MGQSEMTKGARTSKRKRPEGICIPKSKYLEILGVNVPVADIATALQAEREKETEDDDALDVALVKVAKAVAKQHKRLKTENVNSAIVKQLEKSGWDVDNLHYALVPNPNQAEPASSFAPNNEDKENVDGVLGGSMHGVSRSSSLVPRVPATQVRQVLVGPVNQAKQVQSSAQQLLLKAKQAQEKASRAQAQQALPQLKTPFLPGEEDNTLPRAADNAGAQSAPAPSVAVRQHLSTAGAAAPPASSKQEQLEVHAVARNSGVDAQGTSHHEMEVLQQRASPKEQRQEQQELQVPVQGGMDASAAEHWSAEVDGLVSLKYQIVEQVVGSTDEGALQHVLEHLQSCNAKKLPTLLLERIQGGAALDMFKGKTVQVWRLKYRNQVYFTVDDVAVVTATQGDGIAIFSKQIRNYMGEQFKNVPWLRLYDEYNDFQQQLKQDLGYIPKGIYAKINKETGRILLTAQQVVMLVQELVRKYFCAEEEVAQETANRLQWLLDTGANVLPRSQWAKASG